MSEPWILVTTVLGASLVGSLHCVGMCGGFVAAVAGARRGDGGPRPGPTLAYQGTRGLAYVGLGALAGLLGAGLDAGAGALVGVSRLAGPLMGLTLIAMAVATLWPGRRERATLVQLGAAPRTGPLARLRLALTRAAGERGLAAGAAAGLLSALLPCGWLWAYVVVAASTGSAGLGALVMAAFWLGSVPALLGVGLLAGELGRRLGRHAPRVTAAAMLALGVLALVGKLVPRPPAPVEHAPASSTAETEPAEAAVPTAAPCH